MLTVKQAKELGVVFVEGDLVAWFIASNDILDRINELSNWDGLTVTSFTDRKHTGHEIPCYENLPVVAELIDGDKICSLAGKFEWVNEDTSFPIVAWKPDLEELKKLSNKKEEKPLPPSRSKAETAIKTLKQMGYEFKGGELWEPHIVEKQYTYELVTDLSTNEIAKSMIDGEVFYSDDGTLTYQWKNNGYHNGVSQLSGLNSLDFYRRKEVETITRTITYPKPVSEPLNVGDEYWVSDGDDTYQYVWEGDNQDFSWLKQGYIHLTKYNAQAHWDALFGNK